GIGGDRVSASNFILQLAGAAAVTVVDGERENFVVDGVISDPDNAGKFLPNEQAVSHQNYWGAIAINNLGITEANIYDATNIRLRNVALNYTIPTRILGRSRSEEHTSELQSRENLVCRLLLEKKK